MELANSTILVTGGAGFIGSNLVRQLLGSTGAFVVSVDKLTYASCVHSLSDVEKDPRYRFVQTDICNAQGLRDIFQTYHPHCVVNLAAETHVDRSIDAPADFVTTNVLGTFTLLQEALRYWTALPGDARRSFRLHHVSTDEVYGSLGRSGLFTEESPYRPNSPYSASKASSDHLVRAWGQTYGLPTLITNCSNNYGPYQFPEKLIPHMIIRALSGSTLPVYGDGGHIRDWLHVEDHARAIIMVLERGSPGGTYNIGARSERSNLEVVKQICSVMDECVGVSNRPYSDLIEFVPDRPTHDRRYAIDPTKIETEVGWSPKHSFECGLGETVRWYLQNRAWWEFILRRGYLPERAGTMRGMLFASGSSAAPPAEL